MHTVVYYETPFDGRPVFPKKTCSSILKTHILQATNKQKYISNNQALISSVYFFSYISEGRTNPTLLLVVLFFLNLFELASVFKTKPTHEGSVGCSGSDQRSDYVILYDNYVLSVQWHIFSESLGFVMIDGLFHS